MKTAITQKTIFISLGLACIGLNIAALIFQYIFGMEPCVMCIYQRIILAAITPILFLCAYAKNLKFFYIGAITSMAGILYGAKIAYSHAYNQFNSNPFASCSFRPEIYDYIPLDNFIPSVFEVRGACDQINWVFLSLTMPQWLFIFYIAFTCLIIKGAIVHTKLNFANK